MLKRVYSTRLPPVIAYYTFSSFLTFFYVRLISSVHIQRSLPIISRHYIYLVAFLFSSRRLRTLPVIEIPSSSLLLLGVVFKGKRVARISLPVFHFGAVHFCQSFVTDINHTGSSLLCEPGQVYYISFLFFYGHVFCSYCCRSTSY